MPRTRVRPTRLASHILGVFLIIGVIIGVGLYTLTPDAAYAQEKPGSSKPGWVQDFDDVTVKRIKPDDLPDPSEPGASIGLLRTSSSDLPRIATQEDHKKLAQQISPRVLRIVAVQTPPRPYRQVPMLFFGHAIWVSPPAGPDDDPQSPVLLSSLDWLAKADRVYLLPKEVVLDEDKMKPASKHSKKDAPTGGSWRASRRSLEELTAGSGGEKWLKKNKDKLIELTPRHPDRHRNLVQMQSEDKRLAPPASGFELFDTAHQALFKLYGFSPYAGEFVSNVMLLGNHPENPALTFYWQTHYAAILGAPLVAEDGKLVAINTLQHPDDTKVFLAVPTPAIASYLEQHRDSKNTKDTNTEKKK